MATVRRFDPGSNDPIDLNALYQTFLSFNQLGLQGVAIMSIFAMVTVSVLFRVQFPSAIRTKSFPAR